MEMKIFFKKSAIFITVLLIGMSVVWGVMIYLWNNTYYTDFALSDDAFRENKKDFAYVAEYAYGLYENEKKERDDLRRVLIYLWESDVTYVYEDGSERTESLSDNKLIESYKKVSRAFPSPGGEFSVHIFIRDGQVEFSGYMYTLYYSPHGGRPDIGTKACKLKRVSLFSYRWYHCYDKYAI